jgi:hypothetical protein
VTWSHEKNQKKPKLRLTHAEAMDAMRQIQPFIDHARKAGLKGMGWHPLCGVCGTATPLDLAAQGTINVALLMGQQVRQLADWMHAGGLSEVLTKQLTRKWFYKHRTHVLAAFWAYGLGSRIASDGHWLSFPKDGSPIRMQEWYRGRFQYLAFQAEQEANLKEMRNCLKEAATCDRAIAILKEREEDRRGMKGALEIPPEQETRLAEAEARLKDRIIDHRPLLVVDNSKVRLEVPK